MTRALVAALAASAAACGAVAGPSGDPRRDEANSPAHRGVGAGVDGGWRQGWDGDYDAYYYERYGPYYEGEGSRIEGSDGGEVPLAEDHGGGNGGWPDEEGWGAAYDQDESDSWGDWGGDASRSGLVHAESDADGEDWLTDQELDQVLATVDTDKEVAPLLSLEAQIEIVLWEKFQRRQESENEKEWSEETWLGAYEDESFGEATFGGPALKGAEATQEDRGLRKRAKKKKNAGGRPGRNKNKKNGGRPNNGRPNGRPGRNQGNKKNGGGNNRPGGRRPGGGRNQGKNTGYNKHKFGNRPVTKKNNRQYKNICLADPPDRYRTCYARATDPGNDLTDCDRITRNSYNLGAQLHMKNRPIPKGIPKPYTPPYVTSDESVTEGKMHLSLFMVAKKITCDDLIDIEETALKYWYDNIGGDDTFRPACAFVNEDAVSAEIRRNENGRMTIAQVFLVEIRYWTKGKFKVELDSKHAKGKGKGLRRRLQNRACDSSNHHLCCSQESINADVGTFCSNLGCDFASCGRRGAMFRPPGRPDRPPGRPDRPPGRPSRPDRPGRGSADDQESGGRPNRPNRPKGRPNRPNRPKGRPNRPKRPTSPRRSPFVADEDDRRHLQEEMTTCNGLTLEGWEFEDAVKRMTEFATADKPRSLLNDTDTQLVAECSGNWYQVKRGGIATWTCDQFQEKTCQDSEDLGFDEGEILCLEPSAAPSFAPSDSDYRPPPPARPDWSPEPGKDVPDT